MYIVYIYLSKLYTALFISIFYVDIIVRFIGIYRYFQQCFSYIITTKFFQ